MCRAVPKEDVEWVKRTRENRKRFRERKRELRALDKTIYAEISGLCAEIVKDSMEKKAWLK